MRHSTHAPTLFNIAPTIKHDIKITSHPMGGGGGGVIGASTTIFLSTLHTVGMTRPTTT